MEMPTLYIVPVPIGDYDDITLRALKVLKSTDLIICEETKPARKLLAHYGIDKPLFPMNEHNEREASEEILQNFQQYKSIALISDCGTPLFSDPGKTLVEQCIGMGIKVVPLPGANSLTPALAASGLPADRFYFYGWLSPKKDIRKQELYHLRKMKTVIVFLDTPYRLTRLLEDTAAMLGEQLPAVLAYQISLEGECFYRDSLRRLLKTAQSKQLKGEFVLMVDNR